MKSLIYCSLLCLMVLVLGCKKNLEMVQLNATSPSTITLSANTLTLIEAQAKDTVLNVTWTAPNLGYSAAISYSLQIAKTGTNFATPTEVNLGVAQSLKYIGAAINELAIAKGIVANTSGSLDFRVKASISDNISFFSDTKSLSVKTFAVSLPALLVRGGNAWVTPSVRTNGFILTAANYDGKYEGYINLPNADGWGGDALKLVSSTTGTSYGWGTSATTMAVGASGNLWFTPSPNYMKVNADVNALTVNFTPVKFFISGDNNSWSTSATPMTFNTTTNVWEANNVSFTAGNKFVFTSNGNYNISYKIDAGGKLVFAGPPNWNGFNIPVNTTGVYKVTLDLSQGDGNYKYNIQ